MFDRGGQVLAASGCTLPITPGRFRIRKYETSMQIIKSHVPNRLVGAGDEYAS